MNKLGKITRRLAGVTKILAITQLVACALGAPSIVAALPVSARAVYPAVQFGVLPIPKPLGEVSAADPCIGAAAPSSWKVVVFVLENRTYSQVIGNADAPYITSLANKCGSSLVWNDADYKVNGTVDGIYNSKPSYGTLTNGLSPSQNGITTNTYATQTNVASIYDQMVTAGISFKDYYGSSTAGGCGVRWNGDYHDPIRYYSSMNAICNSHDVPISNFLADANAGNLPQFSFVVPNSSLNMHDNSTASGDAYTKTIIEPFLNSADYTRGNVALFLIFDEDTPVPNVLIAPSIVSGSLYDPIAGNNPVSHFSALRTWEEMLGLPLLGNVAQAPSLLAFFGDSGFIPATDTVTPVQPTPTSTSEPPSFTPTLTSTPILPSSTSTPSSTSEPPSSTPTLTSTPVVPSSTPTPIPFTATSTTVPAVQKTVEVRVVKGKDDVEESSTGKMYLGNSDLELVYDANNQVVGIRFVGVNVPKGAAITNAYLQFKVDEVSSGVTTLSIRGEASSNALAFTTQNRNVSLRLKTIKAVSWSPASWLTLGAMGTGQRTPNLAPIVQEIVNRSSWVTGNSLVMIITGTGKRVAKAYDIDPGGAPLLHIEYIVQ